MKAINKIISSLALIVAGFTLHAQAPPPPDFPQIDFKTEKFGAIREKLEIFISKNENGDFDFKKSNEFGEDENPFRHLRHWIMETETHLDENGYVFNYASKNWEEYLKVYDSNIKNRNGNNSVLASTSGAWSNKIVSTVAPANWGHGRTNCIAIDPNNTDIIYTGAIEGGLWKTTTGGTSWYCVTNHLPIPAVASIVINPSNSNNVFILTGRRNTNFFSTAGTNSLGVFVTYDAGINWFSTGLTFTDSQGIKGSALRMSPTNANILIAATTNGLYRTIDGGANWLIEQAGSFFDLEFKPGTSTCYATTPTTVYKSTDNGDSWTPILNTVFNISPPTNADIIELAVTSVNNNVIYLYYYGSTAAKVYKSLNSGTSFTQQSDVTAFANAYPGYLGGYCSALAVSPTNSAVVFLGNLGMFASTNSGLTFPTIAAGIHADQHEIVALSSTTAFSANDGGVYKTTDGGANWSLISTDLFNAAYYGFGGYPSNSNLFIGGTWDNGTMKFSSGTLTGVWGGDRGEAMIKADDPNIMWAVTENDGHFLAISPNAGANWYWDWPYFSCNCPDTNGGPSQNIIEQNPLNPNTIYSMYRDFYVSFNAGTNWTRKISGSGTAVKGFAQGTNDTTRFYAIRSNTIIGSTNTGTTFPTIYTHTSANIYDITVNPSNKNEFYFSCSGYTASEKVYKGTWTGTGSATITNISTGLPNVPVFKVVYQNTSSPGIYAGTEIGVYFRSNATGVWEYFGGGLPVCRVVDMEINYGSNLITAATYGRGLWQSPLYSGCPVSFNHGNYYIIGIPYAYPFIYGQEYYEASNDIHSSVSIYGGYGVDVNYNSGNYILLTDSFEVKEGSEFRAYIQGCTNPVPSAALIGDYAGHMSGVEAMSSGTQYDFSMQLIPNPANDFVNIFYQLQEEGNTQIVLTDIAGRAVKTIQQTAWTEKGSHQKLLDIRLFSNGLYFVSITYNGKSGLAKLMVTH
ncbi:MAG: 3-coathanger stack domain-containing protein [Bacteroidia bacterium]